MMISTVVLVAMWSGIVMLLFGFYLGFKTCSMIVKEVKDHELLVFVAA